jgi:hypothetical protein
MYTHIQYINIYRRGQLGQDSQNGTSKTVLPEQERQNRTGRTGQAEKDGHRRELPG